MIPEEENRDVFYEAVCDVPGGSSDRIVQRTARLWLLRARQSVAGAMFVIMLCFRPCPTGSGAGPLV